MRTKTIGEIKMTLDGLTLHRIVLELKERTAGTKIDKIYQPEKNELILHLRAPGKNEMLLISADAGHSRMHLSSVKKKNPDKPPVFCMFLRKYISGAQITNIEQTGLERIVRVSLSSRDELGVRRGLFLIVELMGKHSNIILTDENDVIMESLKHVTSATSRVREVLPALAYTAPPSKKLNPLTLSLSTLTEVLNKKGERKLTAYLVDILQGVSRETAAELVYSHFGKEDGVSLDTGSETTRFAEHVLSFFQNADSGVPQPVIQFDGAKKPVFFSIVPYSRYPDDMRTACPSANEMLDHYYSLLHQANVLRQKKASLEKLVNTQLKKKQKKLQHQLETLQKAGKADRFRQYGELLTANLYRVKKGMEEIMVENYFSDTKEKTTIPLDPTLSPSDNAQRFYKRYNKLKKSAQVTEEQRRQNQEEIDFLQSVQIGLLSSDTLDEVQEIQYELFKAGYAPSRGKTKIRPKEEVSSPNKFVSADGFIIYAGKNNRQNDRLTLKTAAPNDIWLHTKQIPGAHVVISADKKEVPDTTIEQAAMIAAYYSKAKNGSKVPVDYTFVKHVKKPGGAKPGMVIYDDYKTVYVTPDADMIETLKSK